MPRHQATSRDHQPRLALSHPFCQDENAIAEEVCEGVKYSCTSMSMTTTMTRYFVMQAITLASRNSNLGSTQKLLTAPSLHEHVGHHQKVRSVMEVTSSLRSVGLSIPWDLRRSLAPQLRPAFLAIGEPSRLIRAGKFRCHGSQPSGGELRIIWSLVKISGQCQ